MRAIVYSKFGGPEVLELVEVPTPQAGPGQVLIKVVAMSVNPVDWKIASGKHRIIMPVSLPAIPGLDIAGEVVALGAGVSTFKLGDRVHSRVGALPGRGAAQYAVAGIDVTAHMPDSMDYATAAGLPLAGMTALQSLRDGCELPMTGAKERVLVLGASGGVGHLAVQLAKASGAYVIGVCSAKNSELVLGLGANEVIDYNAAEPYKSQALFDVIVDCVSSRPSEYTPLLTPKGRYASCMPGPNVFIRSFMNPFCGKKARPVMLKSNAADITFLDNLFEEKRLKCVIDSRYPLDQLAQAWERSISGRAKGKIIVDI